MSERKPPAGDFHPCPFCDGESLRVYKGSGMGAARHGQMVKCMDCGARSGYYLTYENLVKGWNRRAVAVALKKLRDSLANPHDIGNYSHLGRAGAGALATDVIKCIDKMLTKR